MRDVSYGTCCYAIHTAPYGVREKRRRQARFERAERHAMLSRSEQA